MSCPESPEPCYDHPEWVPNMEAPFSVSASTYPWMVPVLVLVPVAPLVPDLAPQEIGPFLRVRGMRPQRRCGRPRGFCFVGRCFLRRLPRQSVGGRRTTPPCVNGGRGLGHPGSISPQSWGGAGRPGHLRRQVSMAGRAVAQQASGQRANGRRSGRPRGQHKGYSIEGQKQGKSKPKRPK